MRRYTLRGCRRGLIGVPIAAVVIEQGPQLKVYRSQVPVIERAIRDRTLCRQNCIRHGYRFASWCEVARDVRNELRADPAAKASVLPLIFGTIAMLEVIDLSIAFRVDTTGWLSLSGHRGQAAERPVRRLPLR